MTVHNVADLHGFLLPLWPHSGKGLTTGCFQMRPIHRGASGLDYITYTVGFIRLMKSKRPFFHEDDGGDDTHANTVRGSRDENSSLVNIQNITMVKL